MDIEYQLKYYRADACVRMAFVRVSVTVARLAEAKVDALDGARVTRVTVFAR